MRPTDAGKLERKRNTGGALVCEGGHPIVVRQAAVAVQGVHGEAGRSAESERQQQNGTARTTEDAGTLAASWMRSRCQMKLRSLTRSDKMETKCGIDARSL